MVFAIRLRFDVERKRDNSGAKGPATRPTKSNALYELTFPLLDFISPWQDAHQMPHNICQWLIYVGVVALGCFVAAGVQYLFMDVFLNRKRLQVIS